MKSGSKIMRLSAWLIVLLMGSVWGGTCQLRAPGLQVDFEDDDEMYVSFPGGYIDFGPDGPFIDVPPFELQVEDD